MLKKLLFKSILVLSLICGAVNAKPLLEGSVENHSLSSRALEENLIGLDPARAISVYLPPGYKTSGRRYPVIYHIPFGRLMLDDRKLISLFDNAIADKQIGEFILVSGDFSTPDSINFFGNGPTTGRWLEHIRRELVSFIDGRYRTLRDSSARGISGHFLGGYAAIKLAMQHPDIFGGVYAIHPVGTDTGERSMLYMPDWKEIHSAKSFSDLKAPYSSPFVSMAQAYLPNPDRPPLYADFIVEMKDGELVPNQANIKRLRKTFHLADLVPDHAENLSKLRGIKFNWGRNDANQSHVYGARKLTVLMQDFAIAHEAEEHGGNGWEDEFTREGRVYRDLLPFFNRHLEFSRTPEG